MQTDLRTTPDSEEFAQARKVYKYFFGAMVFIILLVFFEPTFHRLFDGAWQRGRFLYVWTLSIDVHAVVAYVFLFLMILQYYWGNQQFKKPLINRRHRKLGKFLFLFVMPVFILITVLTIIDRMVSVPTEESQVFDEFPLVLLAQLMVVLIWIALYFVRSYRALKQNDYLLHFDSIFGGFMVSGGVVILRLTLPIIWLFYETNPISLPGMYFIVAPFIISVLLIAYRWAGRFHENKRFLYSAIGFHIVFAIVTAPYYAFWVG